MNRKILLQIKEHLEKYLLNGWEDIYGTDFSKNGMIDKEDWEKFWKPRLEQQKLVTEVKSGEE